MQKHVWLSHHLRRHPQHGTTHVRHLRALHSRQAKIGQFCSDSIVCEKNIGRLEVPVQLGTRFTAFMRVYELVQIGQCGRHLAHPWDGVCTWGSRPEAGQQRLKVMLNFTTLMGTLTMQQIEQCATLGILEHHARYILIPSNAQHPNDMLMCERCQLPNFIFGQLIVAKELLYGHLYNTDIMKFVSHLPSVAHRSPAIQPCIHIHTCRRPIDSHPSILLRQRYAVPLYQSV